MKIESCFKICGQVNKIYTVYEVLLVDNKLTLCSFLLISALCHFFSNPLSLCQWLVAMSANHVSICVGDVLHPALLPYSFVYSPFTPHNSKHISCSDTQLLHTYAPSTFYHCQPPLYFLPQGRCSRVLRRTGRDYDIQPLDVSAFRSWAKQIPNPCFWTWLLEYFTIGKNRQGIGVSLSDLESHVTQLSILHLNWSLWN